MEMRASIAKMGRAISSRYGIASSLDSIQPMAADLPPVHLCTAELADFSVFGGHSTFAAGCSINKPQAFVSTLGECFERYSGSIVPRDRLVRGSYKELKKTHALLAPKELDLFLPEQWREPRIERSPFSEKTPLIWIPAHELISDQIRLIPIDLALHYQEPGYAQIEKFTTSGNAAGPSFESAVLAGALELIERDAVMHAWWTKREATKIELGSLWSLPPFSHFAVLRKYLTLLDLQTDFQCPTVLAIFEGSNERRLPALALAAATRADYPSACLKALEELSHVLLRAQKDFDRRLDLMDDQNPLEVRNFIQALNFYFKDSKKPLWKFLTASRQTAELEKLAEKNLDGQPSLNAPSYSNLDEPQVESNQVEQAYQKLKAEFRDKGLSLFVCNFTTPDIQSLSLHVVKVVCPQLLRLNPDHAGRTWGQNRLYTLGHHLGIQPLFRSARDLNPWPHPFP